MDEHGQNTVELRRRFRRSIMPTYHDEAPSIALVRGAGCRVTDADGKEYLDLGAGLAASILGHAHPELAAAIAEQAGELVHTSNQYIHPREIELAERIVDLTAMGGKTEAKVYFCNSGAEANEAALKLVRRNRPKRPVIVSAIDGFHGRTMGALALAGVPSVRDAYSPFVYEVRFVPFGDAEALKTAVGADTAAVFLEPIQGEAGVVTPPPGYLQAARSICDQTGALLVLDEVQSGIGRTGRWFAHQHEGILPDVMTISKGLGGGMPIGACVGIGEFADGLLVGQHGSTFGGNPVTCAAALTVLDVIERDNLMAHAVDVGKHLVDAIDDLHHPAISHVRGFALWRGLVLNHPIGVEFGEAASDAGFLVSPVRTTAIRLAPPMITTKDDVNEFVDALPGILNAAMSS